MKRVVGVLIIFVAFFSVAQALAQPKTNWQNLDLQKDGVFGISTERAYSELLHGKTPNPVVVAVIDGGVDTAHEDLQESMWTNTGEIPGNGIDDDHNGYVDDVHGWNFIGGAKGEDVSHDNLEVVRLIRNQQPKYASMINTASLTDKERVEWAQYRKMITEYMEQLENAQRGFAQMTIIKKTTDAIVTKIGKPSPTLEDLKMFTSNNDLEKKVIKMLKNEFKKYGDFKKVANEINEGLKYYDAKVNYHLNLDFDPRNIVGDDYLNSNDRKYGNADVKGPDAEHGTHVSGIIAASRSNNIGILGVANSVRIMAIRVVPDGDERDKDVANGIRYAADNGAKVINMSFGKGYFYDKKAVDEAVQYALSKDVLLVHAAGNDARNTDKRDNYPNKFFLDSLTVNGKYADAWIEVGASGWENDEDLVANFSNYGKKVVDVFAPGVKINSSTPNGSYEELDGTSMAAPVVSGLATLIRSYYPNLTAIQVKKIIMDSVSPVTHKVRIKDNGVSSKVLLSDICVSGGIVNAYKALQLAATVDVLVKNN